jgi:hypothetical protein|tara:strand:- start:510 stop:776 length:267 start_codon:yes stop_codon:yes gene_type:complete
MRSRQSNSSPSVSASICFAVFDVVGSRDDDDEALDADVDDDDDEALDADVDEDADADADAPDDDDGTHFRTIYSGKASASFSVSELSV